jgi:hypothetical protein
MVRGERESMLDSRAVQVEMSSGRKGIAREKDWGPDSHGKESLLS